MKKFLLLTIPAVAVMACGDFLAVDTGPVNSKPNMTTLNFVCPEYKNYTATMESPTADIMKTNFGGNQTLVRTRAASGELFSNGSYQIHMKADEALLIDSNDNTVNCQIVK